MKAVDFSQYEKEDLVDVANELHLKLQKKKQNLSDARNKLQTARKRLSRLKEAVTYQQQRIIELTRGIGVKIAR
jgi:chromosome segregation ATPase